MGREIREWRELPDTPLAQKPRSPLSNPGVQGLLVFGAAIVLLAVFLVSNQQPDQHIAVPKNSPQQPDTPTAIPDWRLALEGQLQNPATAQPTQIILPSATPTNTLVPTATSLIDIVQPEQLEGTPFPTRTPGPTGLPVPTAEFRGSTPVPSPSGLSVAVADDSSVAQFQPPPEQIPLSLQPFDHFFMRRPVDASANGESLFYYPYGSGGQVFRIHHGIDIPNPEGEHVLAASDGTVVFAGRSLTDTVEGTLEVYASYGNMVVIQHDFGFKGQRVWTLYAHMSALLVEKGDRVNMGDIIGLVGETGYVTGSHVHFEVRVGINNYWNTRNPLLWIAPYLNHGVVAGRVTDSEGKFIENALVQINRSGRRVDSTTTYLRAREPGYTGLAHIVPDDNWNENFVLGDVPAGEYQVVLVVEGRRATQNITVRPGIVNFVEFQIDPPETVPEIEIQEDPGA